MSDDERAKRLLSDLSIAIRKDPQIDEFGFIFCPEPVCNKSPIVLEHHKLGIETWSIKILYLFVHQQLLKVKPLSPDSRFLNECSQAAVLLNAECYTAWNIRKRLVLKKAVSAEADLKLATLVLTKHPKSAEIFAQRRWLLQHIFPGLKPTHQSGASPDQHYHPHQNQHPSPSPNGLDRLAAQAAQVPHQQNGAAGNQERIVAGELKACTIAADRYPNNYNAWSHRIWVLKYLSRRLLQVVKSEWSRSKEWVRCHISDHSGFHYRQFLMQTLRESSIINPHDKENGHHTMGLVEEELQFTANLISFYPGHEAIWYHRRFVIHFWRTIITGKPSATTNSTEPLSEDDITVLEDLSVPESSIAPSPWPHQSLPSSDDAQMETDPVLCKGDAEADNKSVEEELATITTSEMQFADAVNACTPHGDVASQRRCVEGYKRWLKSDC